MSRITLSLTGTQLVSQQEYPSLLVALESHNIWVEYQCREGYCGSCRVKLVTGKINWLTKPLALVQPDEILPCCCKAKGDIELEL